MKACKGEVSIPEVHSMHYCRSNSVRSTRKEMERVNEVGMRGRSTVEEKL